MDSLSSNYSETETEGSEYNRGMDPESSYEDDSNYHNHFIIENQKEKLKVKPIKADSAEGPLEEWEKIKNPQKSEVVETEIKPPTIPLENSLSL